MRAHAIVAVCLMMISNAGAGCGSGSSPPADDAGVPRVDAAIPVDAAVDAGATPTATHRVEVGRTVAGSVRASSAHYRLMGTTSAGGGPSSSPGHQLHQ